jgi:hypothetical protein
MEVKFGPLEKRIKTIDINRNEISPKYSQVHPFWPQKNEEILEELTVEQVDEKLRKYVQIKLATTCNKNEQQQVARNNEIKTKSTTTTWKTFEKTVRRGRNRSSKA